MEIVRGGFALSDADEKLVNRQRTLTAQVNSTLIQVGAVFLNQSDKGPKDTDWFRRKFKDTNLQEWIDDPDMRLLNLGFNLQLGWCDVDIDCEDPRYNACIIKGFKFIGIDTRFAFGRASKGVPTHLLVQLTESDQANYDELKEFAPKAFNLDGKRYWCDLRSVAPLPDNATGNTQQMSRQTVVPGSIYKHKIKPGEPDVSVWYGNDGKIASHVSEIAVTTSHRTYFSRLIDGIAFGTMLYMLQPHWIEGGRQVLATKLAGFLARLVRESQGINDNEAMARGTYCPIGTPETAESLIDFICAEMGDDEPYMRKRTFRDALRKLDNNPDAKIPGWPAMAKSIGHEAVQALHTVLMPGVDVSPLTKLAEQLVLDKATGEYIDRHAFNSNLGYTFDAAKLYRIYSNEFMEVGGKRQSVMKLFEASPLRRSVDGTDLFPNLPPGSIFLLSKSGMVLSDDTEVVPGDGTMTMFNTWRGFPVQPTKSVDLELLRQCEGMLDQQLTYLCQGNIAQMNWFKMWLAFIVQNPGEKQQVAPVIVGGQGVGKSFFCGTFLEAIFGNLHGYASPKVLDGAFSIEPFIGKIVVFIDEAKFRNEEGVDEMKKLVRNDRIGGAEKFKSSRTYRVYARPMFASNRYDMNAGAADDRALYYIKAYDREFMNLNSEQFKKWSLTLKPFFREFAKFIQRLEVKEHFMHIFNTIQVQRYEIEDISTSSSGDAHIVESNMSYPRRVAKYMIEDARVIPDMEITCPFTVAQMSEMVRMVCEVLGINRPPQTIKVIEEFMAAGILDRSVTIKGGRYCRFKFKAGTLFDMFGDAIGIKLDQHYEFGEDDYGDNKSEILDSKPWRGSNSARFRI